MNVVNIIDNINIKYSERIFDFIALQEATNYIDIIKHSKFLSKMLYVHSRQKNEDMITLYNHNKYKLEAVSHGNLSDSKNDERPIQILFLHDLQNFNKKIIFINLHKSHSKKIDHDEIQYIISNSILTNGKIIYYKKNYKNINKHKNDISNILNNFSKSIIIMAGDFNDSLWDKNIKPFKYTNKKYKLHNIIVNTNTKPPNTCCTPSIEKHLLRKNNITKEKYISDYILVSKNIEEVKSNFIPSKNIIGKDAHIKPSSDHLPIISILHS